MKIAALVLTFKGRHAPNKLKISLFNNNVCIIRLVVSTAAITNTAKIATKE